MVRNDIKTSSNRIVIFIDGSNINHTMKDLGWDIDWNKLKSYFSNEGHLVNVFYYMVEKKPLSIKCQDYQSALRNIGYIIKKKDLKTIYCSESKTSIYKGDMDVNLTVDVIKAENTFDTCVFLTGDSDFVPLIEYLDSIGKIVKVVSSNHKGTSREIKDAVGMNHISLENIRPFIDFTKKSKSEHKNMGFGIAQNNANQKSKSRSIKTESNIQIGKVLKVGISNIKDYGVFLKNKFKAKILLPNSNLGIDKFISRAELVFNRNDNFSVKITRSMEGKNGMEFLATLEDNYMRERIIERIS